MSKDGTSSSPKLYESMGVPSGISQVGSSRPQNEPTGSSRSPEWKINRDQPTSREIISRVFSYQRWSRSVRFWIFSDSEKSKTRQISKFTVWTPFQPQFGGFFVFTQWLFPRHHNIIWATRKPPFISSKLSHQPLLVLSSKRESAIC